MSRWIRFLSILAMGVLAWPDLRARGQVPTGTKQQEVPNQKRAEELLNNNKYSFQDLLNGDAGAVANAKEIFALTTDTVVKLKSASVLLNIGKADQVEFDYLTGEAEKALGTATEMPWPTVYDKDGKIVDKVNPQFLKWCEERNLNSLDTFESVYFEVPKAWYFLARASDPRTHDLLMKGLHSSNVMIVVLAAEGLARLQAPDALDEIIAAARRAPQETRGAIGRALLFFSDPKAQAAAEEAMNDREYVKLLRKEIASKGWRALYDY